MLTQTVDEIVGVVLEEMEIPANQQFRMQSFALDFIRAMQKDVKSLIPDRDKTQFYELPHVGYNVVRLPGDYYDYISIGTQVGVYVKGLAINNRLTDHKRQPDLAPVIQTTMDNVWYWGGLYGYGMGWGTTGAIDAYGNGGDYGDVSIDMDKRIMITSPTFRFRNLTLRYYTNCLAPSGETCVHPWFIAALKYWLNFKYWFLKGDARWQVAKMEYEKEYLFALQSKYRTKIPTIVKTMERIRGYRHG
jgi:hypothetical protein